MLNKTVLFFLLIIVGISPPQANVELMSTKIPAQWQQQKNRQYPLRLIVEYYDFNRVAKIQTLKDRIRDNRSERQAALQQLSDIFTSLKNNIISSNVIKRDDIHREYSHLPMNVLILQDDHQLQSLIEDPRVKAVYVDELMHTNLQQSKTLLEVNKTELNLAVDGSGSSVVVLDTGVDYSHSDFGSCSAPGVPSTCRVIISSDLAPSDGQNDQNGHGTNVSAIVASIASGADLIVHDVFDGDSAFSSDVIAGINWAIANQGNYNIAAINMSLGGSTKYTSACDHSNPGHPFANPYQTPIADAKNAGMLTVISSGNEAYIDGIASPACLSDALSVGAVYDSSFGNISWGGSANCSDSTAADKVTCFSNSAAFLKLLAPGALINAGGYSKGGTSQAAPHVAALVAILQSVYPTETASQIENRIISSSTTLTDSRNGLSFPRINVWKAVGAINNDFEQAISFDDGVSQLLVNTENADKQPGEPNHAGVSGGKSVWYAFAAVELGSLTLDTDGSDFDTVLAAYSGSAINNLTVLAENNDFDENSTSALTIEVNPGTNYWIAVDGVADSGGELILNSHFLATPEPVEVTQIPVLPVWAVMCMISMIVGISQIKRRKWQ